MLQRIQSFYLVLVVCAVALMFYFPIATYTISNPISTANTELKSELGLVKHPSKYLDESKDPINIYYVGQDIVSMKGWWLLPLMALLLGMASLWSIFMYRNRIRQMRVVAGCLLLNVAYLFVIFFWAINGTGGTGGYVKALSNAGYNVVSTNGVSMWTAGSIAPIVTIILLYLAQRAIRRDELKVRAADRLR